MEILSDFWHAIADLKNSKHLKKDEELIPIS